MSLNLIAWINETGYGYHGVNVVNAASKLGVDVALWSLGDMQVAPMYETVVVQAFQNQARFDYSGPSVNISPAAFSAFHVGKGPRVGWPTFEIDRFNAHEMRQLLSQDLVLVNSGWARNVVEAQVPGLPCRVVPEGVDRSIFHEEVRSGLEAVQAISGTATVFMNVGKWEERKGQRLLLSAFEKAFGPGDNVKLVLACHNMFSTDLNEHWTSLCRNSHLAEKIVVWDTRLPSQHDIAGLMSVADCGVFPSRAEGWNLELLEMMSMGKLVIATDYSAHTEYCTVGNAMLIQIDALEQAQDGLWFFGNGNWASWGDLQEEQLIEHMRRVHRLKQEGFDLCNRSGIETAKKFSWENSVRTLLVAIA